MVMLPNLEESDIQHSLRRDGGPALCVQFFLLRDRLVLDAGFESPRRVLCPLQQVTRLIVLLLLGGKLTLQLHNTLVQR